MLTLKIAAMVLAALDLITQPLGGVSAITTSRWGKSLLFTMPRRGIVSSKTPGLKFVSDMGYLLQLRRSGEAAHKINSCVHSFLSFVLQIILIQFTEGTFATTLPISSPTATTSFSVHVMCARNCLTRAAQFSSRSTSLTVTKPDKRSDTVTR